MATIPDMLKTAIGHHHAGRLEMAKELYRQILQVEPNRHEAIHLQGLVAHQEGQHEAAAALIGRAIALCPNVAEYFLNFGAVLVAQGKMTEAEECHRQALALKPGLTAAQQNLGSLQQRPLYPLYIPPIRIQAGLDFLLLALPPHGFTAPVGLGYVHNTLRRAEVCFQTVDANILMYHRYHQRRVLGQTPLTTAAGFRMKEDPWDWTANLDWTRPDVLDFFWPEIRDLLEQIQRQRPKVVGLSVNAANRVACRRFIRELRALAPDVIVVLGGYDCLYPDIGPSLNPDFDYMVVFEAELTLGPLAQALARGERPKDLPGVLSRFDTPGRVFEAAPVLQDLDAVDYPRYQWIDPTLYQSHNRIRFAQIAATRGCRWSRCCFCQECFPFRTRKPARVVDELEEWMHRGALGCGFNESDMNGDPEVLYQICSEIIRRGVRLSLIGQLRVDKRNTLEYFQHLQRAGVSSVRFGVDGWSEHTLRLQKKGYTIPMAIQNLRDARAAGIQVTVNMLVGVPGETDADVEEIIQNVIRCREFAIVDYIFPLNLRGGSEYYLNADQHKIRFRGRKQEIMQKYRYYVPDELWYSEDPYIDQDVRTQRLMHICNELQRNGVTLATPVLRLMTELQKPGYFVDGAGNVGPKRPYPTEELVESATTDLGSTG